MSSLVPAAPVELGVDAVASWELAWTHVDEPEVHVDAITAYVRAVDRASVARERWLLAGRPMVGGYPARRSPLLVELERSEQIATRLRSLLRLDPEHRKTGRAGRPSGATSAPDRVAGDGEVERVIAEGEPPKVTGPRRGRLRAA